MTIDVLAGAAGDALALIRLLREAAEAGAPREALHLRLDDLESRLRQPHRGRLIEDALDGLRGARRIRLFALPNADLVAVAPVGTAKLREAALRTLLAAEDGSPPPVSRLRLPEDAAALFAAIEAALAPCLAATPTLREAAAAAGDDRAETPFNSADLAAMERALAGADLSPFLRQRPVCRLAPGDDGPTVAWREWRVALPALFDALAPEDAADPAACPPWLLRRLRRTLDRRLLVALARPDRIAGLGATLLRLLPASVHTPEFARFAEALGPVGRATVTIGVRAEDVLADPEGFAASRDHCSARGFRTALVDTEAAALAVLPPHRLGLDLLQLCWSPGLPTVAAAALASAREAMVLSGADTAAAIGWGWEQGITLFEGRLLRPRGG